MGGPLWWDTAVRSEERRPLAGERSAEVCIVGGGVGGLAAAHALATGGASVVLLEADRIGSGAVGRSSGFVNAGLWVPPSGIVRSIGEVHGRRLIAALDDAPRRTFELIAALGLPCDADRRGTLQGAPDESALADLKERFAAWNGPEGDLAIIGAAETAARTGTAAYKGALVDRRAGVLQPLSYVRGLAQAAERAGAVVCEGSAAHGFTHAAGRWRVSTEAGSVSAGWLLLATEAHTIGKQFGLGGEYVPMPYFNAATRPLTAPERAGVLPAGQPLVDLRKVVSSYRFDGHGRLVVGSIGEVLGLDGAINRAWVSRKVARLFPALRGVEIESAWAGRIGVTDDHMPTIHGIGPRAYALGGYNGRGIAAGTVFGMAISSVMLGRSAEEDLPVPVTAPRAARMAALRGRYIRTGAAAFHLTDGRRS